MDMHHSQGLGALGDNFADHKVLFLFSFLAFELLPLPFRVLASTVAVMTWSAFFRDSRLRVHGKRSLITCEQFIGTIQRTAQKDALW